MAPEPAVSSVLAQIGGRLRDIFDKPTGEPLDQRLEDLLERLGEAEQSLQTIYGGDCQGEGGSPEHED
jgi:hypothetical protein